MASAGGRSGNYNAIGSLPFGSQNLTFDGGSERDLSSGCAICGLDDDHARMLVCDGCNAEYHMYCLTPALSNIPENNWYCDSCCRRDASSPSEWKGTDHYQAQEEGDGLDELVSALPEEYVEKFGEIVWAQGGTGYGWWPSCIFDPRLTLGNTRELARKNLGKRHLIYFFQCDEAPFSVLHSSKIQDWTMGLVDSLYLGKAARSFGKKRYAQFRQAHQAAILEESKPLSERLQWNNLGAPPSSPTKSLASPTPRRVLKKRKRRNSEASRDPLRTNLSFNEFKGGQESSGFARPSLSQKLYCQVNRQKLDGIGSDNLGFVRVDSLENSTFSHVRTVITNDLEETVPRGWDWRFFVPPLGRVSLKQEDKFGAMLPFLRAAAAGDVGRGTIDSPIAVELVDA